MRLTKEERAFYDRHGYLVKRAFYTPSQLDLIKSAFMEAGRQGPVKGISEEATGLEKFDPLATYPRMLQPHRYPDTRIGQIALEFMLDVRLEPILCDLMNDEPIGSQTMFYFKPPGARGQALHQDNLSLQVKPGTCMAAWLAVDKSDAENGGMRVVPGSHTLELLCPEEADLTQSFSVQQVAVPEGMTSVQVDMEPGDLLFFNGSLIHGSGPNATADRFRRSLIAHYVPGSCREVASYYEPLMTFRQEIVRKIFTAWDDFSGPCGKVVANPD